MKRTLNDFDDLDCFDYRAAKRLMQSIVSDQEDPFDSLRNGWPSSAEFFNSNSFADDVNEEELWMVEGFDGLGEEEEKEPRRGSQSKNFCFTVDNPRITGENEQTNGVSQEMIRFVEGISKANNCSGSQVIGNEEKVKEIAKELEMILERILNEMSNIAQSQQELKDEERNQVGSEEVFGIVERFNLVSNDVINGAKNHFNSMLKELEKKKVEQISQAIAQKKRKQRKTRGKKKD